MQQILDSVARLILGQSNFKDQIQVLADTTGIDTRSRDGISHDIVELYTNHKDMSYIEYIVAMLTLMVRSYTGHDDTELIPVLDSLYDLYFPQMTVAEKLFYLVLKFRLAEALFEKPPCNEDEDTLTDEPPRL